MRWRYEQTVHPGRTFKSNNKLISLIYFLHIALVLFTKPFSQSLEIFLSMKVSYLQAMKIINIKELARELKLSASTISKALSNSHEISEDTKQRVLETASRLNYVPNPYASSLRGRKSRNIGLVIPK
jgi:transcriptional regulator with XRE-family HTH domain